MAMRTRTADKCDINTCLFTKQLVDEQQSLRYVKRLLAISVSNILYLRNVFTEDCYNPRKFEDLKLRILSEKNGTPSAVRVIEWIKGAFDAIEKKYLKQFSIGMLKDPKQPEVVFEEYVFGFTYKDSRSDMGFQINANNSKENKWTSGNQKPGDFYGATLSLLHSLVKMTQAMDKLPTDCFMTVKLHYYENVTPEDYEPPGFQESTNDSFKFKGPTVGITVGQVNTAWHGCHVKIRTEKDLFHGFDDVEVGAGDLSQSEPNHSRCSRRLDFPELTPENKRQKLADSINELVKIS